MRTLTLSSLIAVPATAVLAAFAACGSPAQQSGIGRECVADADCGDDRNCLDFAGGYCGIEGCDDDGDCPGGSACVTHTDGDNYCFLLCVDKGECNAGRSLDNEANCSSNVEFVEEQGDGLKACVPPSGT